MHAHLILLVPLTAQIPTHDTLAGFNFTTFAETSSSFSSHSCSYQMPARVFLHQDDLTRVLHQPGFHCSQPTSSPMPLHEQHTVQQFHVVHVHQYQFATHDFLYLNHHGFFQLIQLDQLFFLNITGHTFGQNAAPPILQQDRTGFFLAFPTKRQRSSKGLGTTFHFGFIHGQPHFSKQPRCFHHVFRKGFLFFQPQRFNVIGGDFQHQCEQQTTVPAFPPMGQFVCRGHGVG